MPGHSSVTSIVIMGPAGCGKTTIGKRLAAEFARLFEDADDHHSEQNIEKMKRGVGLTDDDRWPWLSQLNKLLRQQPGLVLACSALKESYRTVLAENTEVLFIFLDVPQEELATRLRERQGHYAGDSLLAGQLATLERPAEQTSGQVTVAGCGSTDEVYERVLEAVRAQKS